MKGSEHNTGQRQQHRVSIVKEQQKVRREERGGGQGRGRDDGKGERGREREITEGSKKKGSKKKQRQQERANKRQSNAALTTTTTITPHIEQVRGFELTFSPKMMAANSKSMREAIMEFTSAFHHKTNGEAIFFQQHKYIRNQL